VSTNHWYDDHRNLAAVAGVMLEDDYDTSDVLDMLVKPWKYADIYLQTIIPAREAAGVPAHSGTYGQHNLKKADFVEHFAVGDRVVRRSSEDAPLNHIGGTVMMTGSSPAQPTAAVVVVHWDGFGPDHLVTADPADLRKVDI
jgi:hypothetical protein